MINPAPRLRLLAKARQSERSSFLIRRIKLELAALFAILLFGLMQALPASGQQQSSLCILISNTVNGVNTTSCVPVSAANPLPATVTGTATATLTASTTPTSGFTAGQLLMSNGSLLVPAGNAVTTGSISALSFTANGVAGVSCAAGVVSLTTLTVTNGIVTHC